MEIEQRLGNGIFVEKVEENDEETGDATVKSSEGWRGSFFFL